MADQPRDPVEIVNEFGAIWSDNFDQYAAGQISASEVRCALCTHAPCDCPEFGTPAYFALIDKRHGITR